MDGYIEVDERTGRAEVYEPDIFGEADILKGPKYVIEPDFPSAYGKDHFSRERTSPDCCEEDQQ